MSDDRSGPPPAGDPGDIWADDETPDVGDHPPRGPATPPRRRGPARPPRRGGPRPTRGRPPGRAGGVRTAAPVVDEPVAIAGGPILDDDEWEDLPPEGRFPRWLAVLVVLGLIVGAVGGGAYWWYDRQVDPPGSPGETVSVEIPQGSSLSGIGSILEAEGVVANSMVFNFYASRQDAGPFAAGVYRLRRNSDIDLVLETMAAGPSAPATSAEVARVAVPEGLTIPKVVARVADQVPRFSAEDLQAALDDQEVTSSLLPDGQTSYEGLLFPATYEVGPSSEPVELLDDLAAEMETRVAGLDPDAAKARIKERFGVDVTTYELVTVASLVQAEAGNAEEAPKIATVIYNRLAEDSTALTLGIDAVDNYGAELAGVDVAAFRETAQPYNTRRVKGLPPTPIGAPGDYALEAAFAPADGPWLYYVLTDPGVHTFAVTDAEFQAAKQICVQKGLGCG